MKNLVLLCGFILAVLSSSAQSADDYLNSAFSNGSDTTWLLGADKKKISFQALLDSNKGKVIYIDFWASWCRPCIAQMPYSSNLKSKLKGRKVVFVYISIDQSFAGWSEAARTFAVPSENSYVIQNSGRDPLTHAWDISSIPRYVIISKKGKVLEKDAPTPSEKMTYGYLKKLSN